MCSLPIDDRTGLEAFRIAGLPSDFYYIPNFISHEEEASILQKVCLFSRFVFSLQVLDMALHMGSLLTPPYSMHCIPSTPIATAHEFHTLKLYLFPTPLQVD